MATYRTSYMVAGSTAVLRNQDVLRFPFTARPQAMTLYARGIERGSYLSSGAVILHVGSTTAATDPRLVVDAAGSAKYRVTHDNGTVARTVTPNKTVAMGNVVEWRVVLAASGAVQLGVATNGGTETLSTATAAAALGPTWAAGQLHIGGIAATLGGAIEIRNLVAVRGSKSLADCRSLAGIG